MNSVSNKAKKTYVTPKLEVYGDVREITMAVGNNGNWDGAWTTPNRTAA